MHCIIINLLLRKLPLLRKLWLIPPMYLRWIFKNLPTNVAITMAKVSLIIVPLTLVLVPYSWWGWDQRWSVGWSSSRWRTSRILFLSIQQRWCSFPSQSCSTTFATRFWWWCFQSCRVISRGIFRASKSRITFSFRRQIVVMLLAQPSLGECI